MSSARKEAKIKIEKSFISSFQGQNDPTDISIANNEKEKKINKKMLNTPCFDIQSKVSLSRKSSAVEEWVEDQNKYLDQGILVSLYS